MANDPSLKAIVKEKFPALFGILSRAKDFGRNIRISRQIKTLPAKIEAYHADNEEAKEVIDFLRSNPVAMIPYDYTRSYATLPMAVRRDEGTGLKYVVVGERKIFFPAKMSDALIADSVRVGLMEQDKRSPHRYLPAASMDIGGGVAILCGASDGLYALEIIDKFDKIFLFEANTDWVEPIKNTLKDYLPKIEIVPLFISDQDGPGAISLDTFLKDKNVVVNYIQADIENAEIKLLKGARKLLERSTELKLCLCCYHTAHQEKELTDFLQQLNYTVRPSAGFLLMWMDVPLRPPFLRRGVLYANR